MTIYEVTICFYASFTNLAFFRILQFHGDASFINGHLKPLVLQGRWSW